VDTVRSRDGTEIAYERSGTGPAVVLVSGGLDDGTENVPLATELARRFTVLNYARRGRGASGDTPPYALEREFEDLAALLETLDEPRCLYGTSSGGALALEAASAGLTGVAAIAVYEVPYNMAPEWPEQWRAYVDALQDAYAASAPGTALELYLRLTGASENEIAAARSSPLWDGAVALEHTLAYDAACLRSGQPDPARLAKVTQPTLVLTGAGADTPGAAAWVKALDDAADAIVAALPHGRRGVLAGETHVPQAAVLAATLAEFFTR
jgi:alpha-beta hydrolase superfamily lysophospholipase